MEKFVKLFWRRKDGAVLAYTAILMPIFLGFIALGFDIASWHLDKRRTQTMADSGAVAAAIAGHRAETEEGYLVNNLRDKRPLTGINTQESAVVEYGR